jgi:hypothetical protein
LIFETRGTKLQHLRLTADGWRHGGEVTVDGYEPCLPPFDIG